MAGIHGREWFRQRTRLREPDLATTRQRALFQQRQYRSSAPRQLRKIPLKALSFVTRETEGRRYLGDFDGAFYVPTLNSGAEDVIVEDGVDHVVFQTAWRSGNPWLYAIRND